MDKVIFYITLIFSGLMILSVFIYKGLQLYKQKKYGNLETGRIMEYYCNKAYDFLGKNNVFKRVHRELSYKLSVFNRQSFEKNSQYAMIIIPVSVLALMVISVIIIIACLPLWYIALIYIALLGGGVIFGFLIISGLIMNSYLKKMPETLKILNSRFSSKKNISKAIGFSLPDFHRTVQGDMQRIYDALKINDTQRAKETFNSVEEKYGSDPHMTMLLELIWIAHYNGGGQDISEQFDMMIQDVIQELENRQDLKSASTGYIVMALLFMLGIPLVRMYNSTILDPGQMAYYSSRGGLIFAGIYLLIVAVLVAILFYTERAGV